MLEFSVVQSGGFVTGMKQCAANIIDAEQPDLLLQLKSGGAGSEYRNDRPYGYEYLASCAEDADGLQCEDRGCRTDCDRCVCALTEPIEVGFDFDWVRLDTQLKLDEATYDYCVDGDQLRLSEPNGPSYTLERVYTQQTGIPPCEDRSTAACEAGELNSEGCRLGSCEGDDAQCTDARYEAACTTVQGCAWDKTRCAGTSVAECSLWHYGRMAGCEISERTPTCAGTPQQCRTVRASECESTIGCTLEPGCVGGTDDECGMLMSQSQCEDAGATSNCQWLRSVCQGELKRPCGELSIEQCEETPGCYLSFAGQ